MEMLLSSFSGPGSVPEAVSPDMKAASGTTSLIGSTFSFTVSPDSCPHKGQAFSFLCRTVGQPDTIVCKGWNTAAGFLLLSPLQAPLYFSIMLIYF